jgi:hypothetical protein
MKLFHIILILAVAIIGAFAQNEQCIIGCIDYGAIDCYGGYDNPIDHIFSVSDPVSISIVP